MKLKTCLALLLPAFTAYSAESSSQVNINVVHSNHSVSIIKLPLGARFSDFLLSSQLPSDIYWRSAQISNRQNHAKIMADKITLLNDLKALQVQWMRNGDMGAWVQSSQQIIIEIDRINVTGRLPIVIDPVINRSHEDKNPILSGDYTLFTSPRSQFIYFTGLINGASRQLLREGAGLADYWQAYSLLAGADLAQAYLIQPTGEVSLVPVAVWNQLHREPMAGATLFVGFDTDLLPAKYKNLNLRIANLLANRIPE
ncbi:capsule biosynthesis GfcC family protein [Aeromonas salmonicida]|uniref:capsule biosynthesis GfcC family protein n=1 Tax=Aeromonas salmonicida TaxID=645 RepID=UPI003D1C4ADC